MQHFSFKQAPIDGLMIVEPLFSEDDRGYFLKSFEKEVFRQHGIQIDLYEDFESFSRRGVVRGLHFQTDGPQAKYVRALSGTVFDVAVDLRDGSPTFGVWHGEVLSQENRKGFYIPKGFAHGFQVLSDSALVSYKCDGRFSPATDTGIVWNDEDLAVEWPFVDSPILSDRDASLMSFKTFASEFSSLGG